MKNQGLYVLGLLIFLIACKRYDPINDKIYAIPSPDNLHSEVALKALEDAIRSNPKNAGNYYKKSLYFHQLGKDSLALSSIQEALGLDSTQLNYFGLLARIYHHLGQTKLALKALQKTNFNQGNDLESWIFAGELSYREKNYDEALKLLNKALKVKPLSRAYYWKAQIEIARGDSSQAIANLREVIHLKTDRVEAYNSLAELYLSYDLNQRAARYADSGLAIRPQHALLNFHKAESFRRRLYFEDSARFYYQKSFQINDSIYMAGYYLGKYALEKYQYEKAEEYFEHILKLRPDLAQAHYYLGVCYRRLGKKTQSVAELEVAIEQDPANFQAKELYWQIKNEILQARLLAREDSIRRAYYQKLAEQEAQRKKELEEWYRQQQKAANPQ